MCGFTLGVLFASAFLILLLCDIECVFVLALVFALVRRVRFLLFFEFFLAFAGGLMYQCGFVVARAIEVPVLFVFVVPDTIAVMFRSSALCVLRCVNPDL